MAIYKLTAGSEIIRLFDNAFIPADPSNTDYIAYLQFIDDGGIPDPADDLTLVNFIAQASADLNFTNDIIFRCVENGVPVPLAWRDYRYDLRAVIALLVLPGGFVYPIQPALPFGI